MSRCTGCNTALTEGEMGAKNSNTGEFEELCKHCRSPEWNNGYSFNEKGEKVPCFVNESFLTRPDERSCGLDGLGSLDGVLNEVYHQGSIKTEL